MPENFSITEATAIQLDKNQPGFVKTPYIREIVRRGLLYLKAGFPLHLQGPSGVGKTALSMHIAAQLDRPVILLHGDEELKTSELVGKMSGFRRRQELDRFIHSVRKFKEEETPFWIDNRLTTACKNGYTLVYDEFTRARPEANNVLLSVLEEKILDLPAARGEETYLKVHPQFKAIFTSNPVEYSGTFKAQDALRNRMLTINLGHYDRETEIKICQARSGVSPREAETIVDIVRRFRESQKDKKTPTIRAAIMIGKVLNLCQAKLGSEEFEKICIDILGSEIGKEMDDASRSLNDIEKIRSLIRQYC